MESTFPKPSGSPSRPVVTDEQVARVAAHLKEQWSVSPYYKARGDNDPDYWMSLAWGMPLLPIPSDKHD